MTRSPALAALTAAAVLALGACGNGGDDQADPSASADATQGRHYLTPDQRAEAREAAGIPPDPSTEARTAFLDALAAIDPRIVKPDRDDQAVSRGLNQCTSIKTFPNDEDKLARLALDRFTITTRLPDLNTTETGEQVNDAAHTHLCPDF